MTAPFQPLASVKLGQQAPLRQSPPVGDPYGPLTPGRSCLPALLEEDSGGACRGHKRLPWDTALKHSKREGPTLRNGKKFYPKSHRTCSVFFTKLIKPGGSQGMEEGSVLRLVTGILTKVPLKTLCLVFICKMGITSCSPP